MKLYTTDNSELMDIAEIVAEGGNLVVTGTIMGAVPVKAVLKPEDMRMALKQMSLPTMAKAAAMPLQGTPAPWILGAGLFGLWTLFRSKK
ncbi:hypothetical protein [Novosphingobium sp. 9U]|uniref:hypothetical protein n=1 Tax=Novosphingobium sp. 9U TaxID=2653158 RepID=UPI0012EF132F|nr:hypothetical protein [Novosphingobium sp. 9U]VWX50162.1 hypothetical protein NOVOSPHI9U_260196 [Novosphingobium sp. 9U]